MPRLKAEKRDQQVYKLDDGAIVTIDFVVGKKPRYFQPADGVVIIGEHVCQPAQNQPRVEAPPSVTNGPIVDTPEMIAWKNRRAKPLTSADTAREQGFPTLDFETAQRISASMSAGGEETIVE